MECVICQEESQDIRECTDCSCKACKHCINEWFQTKTTCPQCRRDKSWENVDYNRRAYPHNGTARRIEEENIRGRNFYADLFRTTDILEQSSEEYIHRPSGTQNFSRIHTQAPIQAPSTANHSPAPDEPRTVEVFAPSFNVARIMAGMGGTSYAN